ncbi:MAG: hypothetical protein LBL24_11375 [Bacteroidales bacterium]|jgi:hypothetical protein|nr:hypothetical protein [Bacteroidales bacterium]
MSVIKFIWKVWLQTLKNTINCVSQTALKLLNIEMKWSRDGVLPPYFVLVSGFFTNIDIQQLKL